MTTLEGVRFTAREAYPLLGLASERTIQQMVRRGKLRSVGRRWPGGAQLFTWPDLIAARTGASALTDSSPVTHI